MKAKTTNKNKARRGVYYVRVSTDDQVEGTSLDDQERQCLAALQAAGTDVVKSFREEGASAKTANRKVLMEAVAFCLDKRNQIGVFLVWKVDRLARNTEDHFAIRKILKDAGVELRSVTEPIGNDPSGKLFEVMVAGFAEFDNSIRQLRSVNGMRARIREGIWPFKAPVGYRNRSLARQSIKKSEPDPVDPLVFPLLQRMLQGFAKGLFTQTEIVGELEKANFQALAGVKPTRQYVEGLLTRNLAFYAGILKDSFGEEVEYFRGRHEPMITEAEMRAIERNRSGGDRIGLPHDVRNPAFPLRRLVRCSACDRPLTGSSPKGKYRHYDYYHCFNRACPLRYKNFPKAELEDRFRDLLISLTPSAALLDILVGAATRSAAQRRTADEAAHSRLEATLGGLASRRRKIFEMAESGAYDAGQAKERLAVVDREIDETNLALARTTKPTLDIAHVAAKARRVIEMAMANWFNISPEIGEKFQKLLFPEGISYVPNRGFGTLKLGPIFALFRDFQGSKSLAVHLCRLPWNSFEETLGLLADLDFSDEPYMSDTKSLESTESTTVIVG